VRTVQRVRHGADELPCRVARQLRIAIEGDDVLDVGQQRRVADDEREARAKDATFAATQQGIQVGELAALALMPHPDLLLRVPEPRAMEEKEDVAPAPGLAAAVLLVEPLDPRLRQVQQRSVVGQ
jgi:hypothetical protein